MNNINNEQNEQRKNIYVRNLKKLSIDHWSNSTLSKNITNSLLPNQYPDPIISEEVALKVKQMSKK